MIPIAAMYFLTLNNHWIPSWDSAIYISLAKSLAAGDGYKYMGFSHTKYPFVFPLLLSPIPRFFGDNFLLMRLLIVILGICSIYLVYLLSKQLLDKWLAILIMLLTASSHSLLSICTRIFSEIPYLFFSLISIIFIDKYSRDKGYLNRNGLITILFLLLAYFTRSAGISLAAAVLLFLIWKDDSSIDMKLRFKKAGFVGLTFIIFASAWGIRNQLVKEPFLSGTLEGSSYIDLILEPPDKSYPEGTGVKNLFLNIPDSISYYGGLIPRMIVQKPPRTFLIAKLLALFIILWGFIYCSFKRRGISEYYFSLYIAMYIPWPYRQGERFLVPVIPFIFYYFIIGLKLILKALGLFIRKTLNREILPDTFSKALLSFVVLGLICYYLNSDIKLIEKQRRNTYYTGEVADFINVIKWLGENTPINSVVVSDRAPWVYLLSGRKTFSFPRVHDEKKIMESIYKFDTDYVIVSPVIGYAEKYLKPVIQGNVDRFELVHQNESGLVFRVRPER